MGKAVSRVWKNIENVGFLRVARRTKKTVSDQEQERFVNLFFNSPFPIGYIRQAQHGEPEVEERPVFYSIGVP